MDSKRNRLVFSALLCFLSMLFILFLSYQFFPVQRVQPDLTQDLAPLPETPPEPEPDTEVFEEVFPVNSTFEQLLLQYDIDRNEIEKILKETSGTYNWNRVMAGRPIRIERWLDGSLKQIRYEIDDEEYLIVDHHSDQYVASRHQHQFEVTVSEIYGKVDGSLWNTLISAGEGPQLVAALVDVLRWDLDFTGVQPGDYVKLIVEKKYLQDRFIKYGDLLAVQFSSGDKNFYGFLFPDPETGKPRYYDDTGHSVRKAFLQVPFNFDPRVTSGFSRSRYHPVLKKRRPHLGVDYGAPTGTPVLASASGTVIFAGRNGGYGKQVKIRHSNGYVSSYGHLSKIEVRSGQRVGQADRIGRVGSTGLSTGPHLDYRIQNQKGVYIDPRKLVSLPSEEKVPSKYLQEFNAVRERLRLQLNSIDENSPSVNRIAVAG